MRWLIAKCAKGLLHSQDLINVIKYSVGHPIAGNGGAVSAAMLVSTNAAGSAQSPTGPTVPFMPIERSNRPVRSYVLREGRLTSGQERALEDHWHEYGVDVESSDLPLDFTTIYGNPGPVVMEVGFGDGGALREMAQSNPQWNLLGVEVHRPGIGNLLRCLALDRIDNVRVVRGDAVELLDRAIAPGTLHRIHLYFPDPWPKKKHHKRRILSPEFAELAASRLMPGSGLFHFASDWEDYAAQALEILSACPLMENTEVSGGFAPRPEWRPLTRFEMRGRRLGHKVRDILMKRS